MRKGRGPVTFLIASLVLAVAAGYAFVTWTTTFSEAVSVPVAVRDIRPYEKITADMVKMQDVPRISVPRDAVLQVKDMAGQYTRETILAGEPIRQARIAQQNGANAVLTAKVTALGDPDLRAFALPYDTETAVGGEIVPGDRVDIIASVRMESQGGTVGFGKVVGANVLVLDIAKPAQGKTSLIVALTPSQIEDIAFALSSGTVRFALNPYNTNAQAAATTGVTGQDWLTRHGYGTSPSTPSSAGR